MRLEGKVGIVVGAGQSPGETDVDPDPQIERLPILARPLARGARCAGGAP